MTKDSNVAIQPSVILRATGPAGIKSCPAVVCAVLANHLENVTSEFIDVTLERLQKKVGEGKEVPRITPKALKTTVDEDKVFTELFKRDFLGAGTTFQVEPVYVKAKKTKKRSRKDQVSAPLKEKTSKKVKTSKAKVVKARTGPKSKKSSKA